MYRFLGLSLGILSIALFGALFGSSSANAASQWDNAIQLTDKLVVQHPNCEETDVSINLTSHFFDTQNVVWNGVNEGTRVILRSEILQALDTGGWVITQVVENGTKQARFIFNKDTPSPYIYDQTGGTIFAQGKELVLSQASNCNFVVFYIGTSFNSLDAVGLKNNSGSPKIFLSYNYPLNLPEGYAGAVPPDTYTPPVPPITGELYGPRFYVSSSVEHLVTIHDLNFNTFDPILWTCNDGTSPILDYWIVKNSDNARIVEESVSPTVQIEFEAPLSNDVESYTISGDYDCGTVGPVFNQVNSMTFEIGPQGNLHIDLFEDCFTEDFPFINVAACTDNLFTVIDLMAFGTLRFPFSNWNDNDPAQCQSLTVLHTWIGMPNNYICPAFSPTVRNTITPFFSILLAIITVTFIARLGDKG